MIAKDGAIEQEIIYLPERQGPASTWSRSRSAGLVTGDEVLIPGGDRLPFHTLSEPGAVSTPGNKTGFGDRGGAVFPGQPANRSRS
jgi:hypothetical protein